MNEIKSEELIKQLPDFTSTTVGSVIKLFQVGAVKRNLSPLSQKAPSLKAKKSVNLTAAKSHVMVTSRQVKRTAVEIIDSPPDHSDQKVPEQLKSLKSQFHRYQ